MSHVSPKSIYYTIFSLLMVFTGLTVFVAFTDVGALNFPVAIGIAITKATLVILFFMHVKYSSQLTKLFVGMAFFFMLILFGLTLSDYLTRGWKTYPGGAGGAGYGVRTAVEHAPAGEHSAGEGEPKSGEAAH